MSRSSWQNDAEEFQRLRDALKQCVGRSQAMRTAGTSRDPRSGMLSTTGRSLHRMVTLLVNVGPSGAD